MSWIDCAKCGLKIWRIAATEDFCQRCEWDNMPKIEKMVHESRNEIECMIENIKTLSMRNHDKILEELRRDP